MPQKNVQGVTIQLVKSFHYWEMHMQSGKNKRFILGRKSSGGEIHGQITKGHMQQLIETYFYFITMGGM